MTFEWIGLIFLLLVLGFPIWEDLRHFGGRRRRGTGEVIAALTMRARAPMWRAWPTPIIAASV
jgi:hypothetical protein